MYFDWTMIILIPGLIFSIWAQWKISSSFNRYSKIGNNKNLTADKVAANILRYHGINDVEIEPVGGSLTDHYDPRSKTLRLSSTVYQNTSIAALGVAAHEAGHAIQHAQGNVLLKLRNTLVPIVNIGSFAAIPLFILGLIIGVPVLATIGIYLFAGIVGFHLITLPVELDASKKAIVALNEGGYLENDELIGAKKVLNAAAMTYVAAALMAILDLIRLLLIVRGND